MKKIWITNYHENENLVIWFQTKLPFDVFNIFFKTEISFFSLKEKIILFRWLKLATKELFQSEMNSSIFFDTFRVHYIGKKLNHTHTQPKCCYSSFFKKKICGWKPNLNFFPLKKIKRSRKWSMILRVSHTASFY